MSFRSIFIPCALLLACGAPSPAQITATDDLGRRVDLSHPAGRIVSLAPSITETLFALGGGEQIAGVTAYCNYPGAARLKPRVGGMLAPSMEAIAGLSPDLIILSMEGNARDDFEKLTALGAPVFVSNPRTLSGIRRSIEQLGLLTGRGSDARALNARLLASEDSLRSGAVGVRIRTLFFVSLQPLMAVGDNTFLAEMLEAAGGKNLASGLRSTYPLIGRESVMALDPDVVLITTDALPPGSTVASLFPEWSHLRAAREARVFTVNADLVSRPGPRAIEGLRLLVHFLHDHP